jgi:hypothetical protein
MIEIDRYFKEYHKNREELLKAVKQGDNEYVGQLSNFVCQHFMISGRHQQLAKYKWPFNRFVRDLPMQYREQFRALLDIRVMKKILIRNGNYEHFTESLNGAYEPLVDIDVKKEDFRINSRESGFEFKRYKKHANYVNVDYMVVKNGDYFQFEIEVKNDEAVIRGNDEAPIGIITHLQRIIEEKVQLERETRLLAITGSYPIQIELRQMYY